MTTLDETTYQIPVEIAENAILPASYLDTENKTFPAYAWLRKNAPLAKAKIDGFDPIWLVSTYDDLMEIERQPDLFPSGQHNPILNDQPSDAFVASLTGGTYRSMDVLVYMDPPEHTKVRAIANQWFMPRNVKRFEGDMRAIARSAIDKVLEGDGTLDFVKDFSLGYPLHVIMSLFGIPEEDEPIMLKLTQEFFGVHDEEVTGPVEQPTPDQAARAFAAATQSFTDYFGAIIADRRANPRDDLASLIANSQIDGKLIDDKYATGWFIVISTAGHDTTASTIAGTALALAQDPEVFAKVKADRSLIPKLVEEALRYVSPVRHFMRSASQDVVVSGQEIKKGDRLMLLFTSANRDEDVFPNPDTFDIERDLTKHVAFGTGPHSCTGMHVARLEMKVLLEELFDRIDGIALAGEPKYLKTNFVGGLRSLPVRLIKN